MCTTCERIEQIKQGNDPFFVAETRSGYVVLDQSQLFEGHVLFLSKACKKELYQLDYHTRVAFLSEASLIAQSLLEAFKADFTEFEMLGGEDGHLTAHIIPRHKDDLLPYGKKEGSIFSLPSDVLDDPKNVPSAMTLSSLRETCLEGLSRNIQCKGMAKKDITEELLLDKIFDGERVTLYDRRGTVVAYVDIGKRDPKTRILSKTFVHESYRGKGLGTFLLNEADTIAAKEGTELIKTCSFAQKA